MKIKKIISIILVAALCFTMAPLKANAKEETEKEFKEIRTIEDLYAINNDTSGNYRLMNDIDMTEETAKGGSWDTGHGWTPLNDFSGEFDGNGYRIKGMNIYGNPGNNVGLFKRINGGKVCNLGMVDVKIGDLDSLSLDTYIGTVAGDVFGLGSVSNCYSSGNIVCPKNGWEDINMYVGGITGENSGVSISKCYNTSKIDNSANVDSGYKNRFYVGGIVGYNDWSCLEQCYNAGEISGSGILKHCESNYDRVKYCYYLAGSATDEDNYAIKLTEAQMSMPGVFTGFDFENTWEIDPNSTYKYPQLKGNRHQRVEGISIESLPNKLDYAQGEDITTDGGSIKITYEGGYDTTVLLTKDMLSGYDMSIVGTQTIKVNYGGKTAEFEIKTGEIAVTSVSITGINTIPKGTQMKLSVSVAPENATDNSVKWSSSDESKATVEADGNVTALATGEVTITATASNGVSAAHKLAITAPCVLLMLDESSVTLYKGDTKEIGTKLSPIDTTDKVVWSSSNSNIASVGDSGVITAVSPGETTITAKAGNGKAVCQVTVKQNLSSFYIVGVADKTYTGNSIEQDIKVTDGNVTLNKDEDYTVSYSNNINVGTAEITISGLGYYEGSIKKAFNIMSKKNDNVISKPDNTNNNNDNTNDDTNDDADDDRDYVFGVDDNEDNNTAKKITVGKVTISKVRNIKGRKIEIKYKKVSKAKGYQVRYSLKSNMGSSKTKTTAKTKYTLTSLKKKKKYYIQVRAYRYKTSKKKVYGKWSSKKSIKVNK